MAYNWWNEDTQNWEPIYGEEDYNPEVRRQLLAKRGLGATLAPTLPPPQGTGVPSTAEEFQPGTPPPPDLTPPSTPGPEPPGPHRYDPVAGFDTSRLNDPNDTSGKYVFARWMLNQGKRSGITPADLDAFIAANPTWEKQGSDLIRQKPGSPLLGGKESVWQDVIGDVGGEGRLQFGNATGTGPGFASPPEAPPTNAAPGGGAPGGGFNTNRWHIMDYGPLNPGTQALTGNLATLIDELIGGQGLLSNTFLRDLLSRRQTGSSHAQWEPSYEM